MSSLDDDYYVLDEAKYLIRGQNKGRTYQLGDVVKVKVIEANLQQRTIDFAFVEGE
jgi:ribonuclease R